MAVCFRKARRLTLAVLCSAIIPPHPRPYLFPELGAGVLANQIPRPVCIHGTRCTSIIAVRGLGGKPAIPRQTGLRGSEEWKASVQNRDAHCVGGLVSAIGDVAVDNDIMLPSRLTAGSYATLSRSFPVRRSRHPGCARRCVRLWQGAGQCCQTEVPREDLSPGVGRTRTEFSQHPRSNLQPGHRGREEPPHSVTSPTMTSLASWRRSRSTASPAISHKLRAETPAVN
jgi:hypothetical protein